MNDERRPIGVPNEQRPRCQGETVSRRYMCTRAGEGRRHLGEVAAMGAFRRIKAVLASGGVEMPAGGREVRAVAASNGVNVNAMGTCRKSGGVDTHLHHAGGILVQLDGANRGACRVL